MAVDSKNKPQWKQVLEYFREHDWVSHREIRSQLHINGARARFSELKKRGFTFDDRKVETENSWYKEFKLVEDDN